MQANATRVKGLNAKVLNKSAMSKNWTWAETLCALAIETVQMKLLQSVLAMAKL